MNTNNTTTARRVERLEETRDRESDSLLVIRQFLGVCGATENDPPTPEVTAAAGEALDRFFLEVYRCRRSPRA